MTLTLEAPGGTTQHLKVRRNDAKIHVNQVEGANLADDLLSVPFDKTPNGGYRDATVTLYWE